MRAFLAATAFVALAACGPPVIPTTDEKLRADVAPSDASTAIVEQAAPLRRVARTGIHARDVTTQGRVQCWGANRDGELGRGTESWGAPRPAWVPGIDDAIENAVGSGSTCALHRSGNVSCWGEIVHASTPRAIPDITNAKSLTNSPPLAALLLDTSDAVAAEAIANDDGTNVSCDPTAQPDCVREILATQALRV